MSSRPTIRVMVVDDHQMVRNGLAMFIKGFDDLELVGEAADGDEAIRLCSEVQPDVVLMDIVMPNRDGISATREIRQRCPNVRVIALTSFAETGQVKGMLQAGAIGYLLKDASVDELVDAIRAACEGRPTLGWRATQALINTELAPELTEREREVLNLMADGLTNRQIAARLNISTNTVNSHVRNILSKLGAANRTEAVVTARKHDLLD